MAQIRVVYMRDIAHKAERLAQVKLEYALEKYTKAAIHAADVVLFISEEENKFLVLKNRKGREGYHSLDTIEDFIKSFMPPKIKFEVFYEKMYFDA